MTRAVVFAYHDVGVHCLQLLLDAGVEVALVVTHEDNAQENIWFASVAALCRTRGIAAITPASAADPALLAQVQALRPDFLFSFYYRHLLPAALLAVAPAYNMHGSLLPRYRGRAPVNWAVLHGESETGATLHRMTAKPDAGAIVAQQAVPIGPDDTAFDVFGKVSAAAVQVLAGALPALLAGRAPQLPNELARGSYYGGRRPEDGRIDWSAPAQAVYNLHRAVAPPYPGAFAECAGHTYVIGAARLLAQPVPGLPAGLAVVDNAIIGVCGDGRALAISVLLEGGVPVTPQQLQLALQNRNA